MDAHCVLAPTVLLHVTAKDAPHVSITLHLQFVYLIQQNVIKVRPIFR